MIEHFLSGVLLSLSLELPLGPINATILARSIKYDWIEGLKIGWGAWTADVIIMLFVLFGAFPILSMHFKALFLASGIVLLLLGVDTLRQPPYSPLKGREEKLGDSFLSGLFIGLSNPIQIIWWVTVGVSLFAISWWSIAGVLTGSGIFITVLPFVAGKANKFFGTSFYRLLVIVAGLLLLVFGLVFLYNGLLDNNQIAGLRWLWPLE